MKTFFILVLCTIFSVAAFGQQKSKMVDEVKVTPPTFAGINDIAKIFQEEKYGSIYDYLRNNLDYPEKALKTRCEGTEVIQFEVTKNGELVNFYVINSVSPAIDEAVINLLKTTSGMCKYELGDKEGARQDWDRMNLAGIDNEAENLAENFQELDGYIELAILLNN